MFNKKNTFIASCIILSSLACNKHTSSPIIARVGKSVLTVEDLYLSIPPEYSSQITVEQNINYVKQWIDTELLYQYALRQKIDREREIKKRLDKMKKDLLSAEMIHRTSEEDSSSPINDKIIHTYYELNKQNFKREYDIAKYLEITVSDYKIAWYITKHCTPDNFDSLLTEYSQQQTSELDTTSYTILDDIPPQIRHIVQTTPIGSISNPVKSELGFHIVYVMDKLNKGDICKEEEIRDEIINLLVTKSQKEKIEKLLSDLRLKTNITFNSNLIKNLNKTNASRVQ